jgi:hypothetical protein
MSVEEGEFDRFALFDLLPDLLVEEIGDGIAGRLDQGDGAPDGDTAGQGIAHREGDAKVHGGEGKGLGHIITPVIDT